jgi:hypothetical protein
MNLEFPIWYRSRSVSQGSPELQKHVTWERWLMITTSLETMWCKAYRVILREPRLQMGVITMSSADSKAAADRRS